MCPHLVPFAVVCFLSFVSAKILFKPGANVGATIFVTSKDANYKFDIKVCQPAGWQLFGMPVVSAEKPNFFASYSS